MSIAQSIADLGCVSPDPALQERHLVRVGDGALCARPYTPKDNSFNGMPEGTECIFLHHLQSLKRGGGTEALKCLIDISDTHCAPIVLSPNPYPTALYPVPLTQEDLITYYKRFGFEPLVAQRPGKWIATLLIRLPVDKHTL